MLKKIGTFKINGYLTLLQSCYSRLVKSREIIDNLPVVGPRIDNGLVGSDSGASRIIAGSEKVVLRSAGGSSFGNVGDPIYCFTDDRCTPSRCSL